MASNETEGLEQKYEKRKKTMSYDRISLHSQNYYYCHCDLNASIGVILEALHAGNRPATTLSTTEITHTIARSIGRYTAVLLRVLVG